MPFYRIGDTVMHLKVSGKPPAPCCGIVVLQGVLRRCRALSTFACDWELEDGGTCSAPICRDHVFSIGRNRHLCPIHREQRARVQPELFPRP